MNPASPQRVATDSSVLINFLHLSRLDLFGSLAELEFLVPEQVEQEILDPGHKAQLETAIRQAQVQRHRAQGPRALTVYADLRRVMGAGEAACLASAVTEGLLVACDERRVFRRHAEALLGSGRIVTTPGLMVLLIRAGLLTVEEADDAKAFLERRRFKMTFGSFRKVCDSMGLG